MCGICGFSWEDKQLIKQMMVQIKHRGPDQNGNYVDSNVSLGHQRLSIVDLTKSGKQPLCNEDGTIWITFNGEIFNYLEIKEGLLKKGHRFSSNTDTEVIVHAYEEYGPDCLRLFNGFFAFAIYDSRKKLLFLARDRMGVKPLYYTFVNGQIIFASEIKAILECHDVKREVNRAALESFLTFRCNTLNETMFKGIYKLPPAHYLLYSNSRKERKVELKEYWQIKTAVEEGSEQFYAAKLKESLIKAIKYRLMGEVPLGVYFSGGIDSSAVVGLLHQFSTAPIKTFSVEFAGARESNEMKHANQLAAKFNTDHHVLQVQPDTVKLLPKISWHLDEPMSDPTSIPTYLLSEFTKKKCTIVLTGEGADEILGGYEQYKLVKIHQNCIKRMPQLVRKRLVMTAKMAPKALLDKLFKYSSSLGEEGLKRFDNYLRTDDPAQAYLELVSIFNLEEKKEILGEVKFDFRKEFQEKYFSQHSLLNSLLLTEIKTILPEDLLMKVDKNTMAFAIEARTPFLDYNLVELAFKMPEKLKLNGLTDKYILRKSMQGVLPAEILKKKKERFFVPIDSWMDAELGDLMKQLLSKDELNKHKLFNPSYLEKVNRQLEGSRLFYMRQLWSLMSFQLWHKTFIDEEKWSKSY